MMYSDVDYRPAFIQGEQGRLFTFACWPERHSPVREGVVLVPPFAEEMNKSRRMLTQQAKILAQHGYAALLPDLFGTGESEGDFQDATWNGWCDDLRRAADCLLEEGVEEISFIALRSGALLLSEVLGDTGFKCGRLVLWQPVISGELFLNQFFRLRLAAEMTSDPHDKTSISEIRQELQEQGSTEIAGYALSRELAIQISNRSLGSLANVVTGELHWCEIVHSAERSLKVAARRGVDQLAEAGVSVYLHKVPGYPFWGAAAGEVLPDLLDTTTRIFTE
jgi:exosortase A-associated hydrolase 2